MTDQKSNIARYITFLMDEEEEIAFEAEMAANEDLRLLVQLEQVRLANIRRRVKIELESGAGEKTGEERIAASKSKWRWWVLAVAITALLMVGMIWLSKPDDKTKPVTTPVAQQPQKRDNSVLSTDLDSGRVTPPTLSSPTLLPTNYNKIAHDTYNHERPKSTVSTSGGKDTPVSVNVDTATQAFYSYLEGDSAMVFAYYNQYPNERRAVEWKARYLFEHSRYEDAAVLFARLKTFPKYEDIGAWNELLCILAQYPTKKKHFDRLEKEVRKTRYREDLDRLLKQIR